MRGTFVRTLTELAHFDPRIVLLTGDLGYTVLEPFRDTFPDRFFNVGVAEQNMVGLATGLAEAGFIPFVYSIVNFAVLRPYEFIRNGPVVHRLPVRIVGVGGGFEYGHNGISHYGLDDVGVLRIQPGMTVVAPADFEQLRSALLSTWNSSGPVYYRLGKDDTTRVDGLDGRFQMGRAHLVREGRDVLLVAMGSLTCEVLRAADVLEKCGLSPSVMVVSCVSPPPVEDLRAALRGHSLAVAVEAHYAVGGLGSLVCETAAGQAIPCRVIRCGVDRLPDGITGSQRFMHDHHGLSAERIAENVTAAARELQPVPVVEV